MTILLCSVPGLLLAYGLYHIAAVTLCIPSGRAKEAIRSIHGRRGMEKRLQDMLLPVSRLLSRLFSISEYRQKRLEADFSRLRMTETPQEYTSSAVTKSLLLGSIGLFFIPLGSPWLALITAVAAILAYFQSMQTIRKKVEAQNREMEAELPRLVETMNYSLQESRDLVTFFEKYCRVAGRVLSPELDRLIADMKTGNQEEALRRMDARLGLPSFSALTAVLCGVYQGVDQRVSLLVLGQDLRAKERETLRRSMEKRPGRIKAASFILTALMILLFLVPLVLLILNNLKTVGI